MAKRYRFGAPVTLHKGDRITIGGHGTTVIGRDAWLAALGESDTALDPDALTVQEFGALMDLSNGPARTRLERLVREGKAVKVRKRITLSDGRTQPVGAYRLKAA